MKKEKRNIRLEALKNLIGLFVHTGLVILIPIYALFGYTTESSIIFTLGIIWLPTVKSYLVNGESPFFEDKRR